MVPRSRAPIWNRGVLARRLGDASAGSPPGRYLWVGELGNRNYLGSFEHIEIADYPAGRRRLEQITATGRAIVLLCGCADEYLDQCHRKLLAEWLAEGWTAEVVHLTRRDNQSSNGQGLLF